MAFSVANWEIEVTGTVTGMNRTQVNARMTSLGVVTKGVVSRSTQLLLLGKQSGPIKTKQKEASKLGVPTCDADEFFDHIQRGVAPPGLNQTQGGPIPLATTRRGGANTVVKKALKEIQKGQARKHLAIGF